MTLQCNRNHLHLHTLYIIYRKQANTTMNKTSSYEFTVIVPVFNEEDNMQRLEKELSEFALQSPLRTCVLFVNDGSKDASLAGI